MKRAKVITHMFVSIDGKIDGAYEQQKGGEASNAFYSEELFRLGTANANGANTTATYNAKGTLDLSQFSADQIEYEDWTPEIATKTWQISLDRQGRMGWEVNYSDYCGHPNRVIEVVTKKAKKEYLAFLRSMQIPYLICGETDLDLELVLRKLKAIYHIETVVLSGGAIINGAFLKAHLVDEISMVVTPFVSGNQQAKSAFDTMGTDVYDQFKIKSVKELADGGLGLIYQKAWRNTLGMQRNSRGRPTRGFSAPPAATGWFSVNLGLYLGGQRYNQAQFTGENDMVKFTKQLHEAAGSLWQKSRSHPFVSELQSGELPLAKFRFYLVQDRYYLDKFAKFHQAIANKIADPQRSEFMRARMEDLKATEINVRTRFFKELAITPAEVAATPIAPTAYNYVNHLEMTLARFGVAPAVTAIVPCYWLYQEMGQAMAVSGSPVRYYQEWIDTYDGDWYGRNVAKILELTDMLADGASAEKLGQMKDAFVRSSYYELQFWQMAYEEQKWE